MRVCLTPEKSIIDYFTQLGWEYISPDEALCMRGGEKGIFFDEVLESQLLRLNPEILDNYRLKELLHKLRQLKPTMEGNRDALEWIRGQRSIYILDEKRDRNIQLIDFEHPNNNMFHVTDEWRYQGSNFTGCVDVVFLINGIPVAIAETKCANIQNNISEELRQLQRYHKDIPQMFIFPQVYVVTTPDLNLYYGSTWQISRQHTINWKGSTSKAYKDKLSSFFEQSRFLHMLRDYIFFPVQDGKLTKVILRQHQIRAIEKVLQLTQKGPKQRALLWHAQGSGKTLTMVTIASRLLQTPRRTMPTILMAVDRTELETQLLKNIQAYGISAARAVSSKKDLQDSIETDYRGLIISTIHKFEGLQARANQRDDIVVLIDEVHRSMTGIPGSSLIGTFPNASYIGFTSTPIHSFTRNTSNILKFFQDHDEDRYLDTYSTLDSIKDGTTVAINYALAPDNLRVDSVLLEKDFFQPAEIIESDDFEELSMTHKRSSTLEHLLKSQTRINEIASFIAGHFREHVDPLGFKALLVAADRETCVSYKRALDQYLPPNWSEAVYSSAPYDLGHLSMYALREDEERNMRRNFLRSDYPPKILIVTQKLLTGFDAPILYCLYLDKPMRDHSLFQAISRVNRPYQDHHGQMKPYGLIIDFIGIFDQINRMFSFTDTEGGVVQDINMLEQRFATLIQEKAQGYLRWTRIWDDKTKEQIIAHFKEKTRRDDFFEFFSQLQNIYGALAPSRFLNHHFENYKALAQLFVFIQKAYTLVFSEEEVLSNRTLTLLNDQVTDNILRLPGAIYELNAQELTKLEQSHISEPVKILNLHKVLATTFAEKAQSQPYLRSLSDHFDKLIQVYENHSLTSQQTLDQLEELAQQYLTLEEERLKLGIDKNTYTIYITLKSVTNITTQEQAYAINTVFKRFPNYQWDEQQGKQARTELYSILHPTMGVADMIKAVNMLMVINRILE